MEVEILPWESGAPHGCRMPSVMEARVEKVLVRLREIHCAGKMGSHECSGRLIVDRNGMTLSCPLCGDAREVYGR